MDMGNIMNSTITKQAHRDAVTTVMSYYKSSNYLAPFLDYRLTFSKYTCVKKFYRDVQLRRLLPY